MVVSVDEYALQQQNAVRSQEDTKLRSDDAIQAEIKAAEEFGMTVAAYREQQKSYADATKQAMENKHISPDPPIEVISADDYVLQQQKDKAACFHPSTDPHHQFTIGSMVRINVQKGGPLYGVLQWVGTLPDFPGTIAGVELVSDYEKCVYYLVQLIGAAIKKWN